MLLEPEETKLHPFATDVIIIQQKKKLANAMTDTADRAIYLFSGIYNPFAHQLSTSPQSHICMVNATGKLQVTARCIFPYLRVASFREAVKEELSDEPNLEPNRLDACSRAVAINNIRTLGPK